MSIKIQNKKIKRIGLRINNSNKIIYKVYIGNSSKSVFTNKYLVSISKGLGIDKAYIYYQDSDQSSTRFEENQGEFSYGSNVIGAVSLLPGYAPQNEWTTLPPPFQNFYSVGSLTVPSSNISFGTINAVRGSFIYTRGNPVGVILRCYRKPYNSSSSIYNLINNGDSINTGDSLCFTASPSAGYEITNLLHAGVSADERTATTIDPLIVSSNVVGENYVSTRRTTYYYEKETIFPLSIKCYRKLWNESEYNELSSSSLIYYGDSIYFTFTNSKPDLYFGYYKKDNEEGSINNPITVTSNVSTSEYIGSISLRARTIFEGNITPSAVQSPYTSTSMSSIETLFQMSASNVISIEATINYEGQNQTFQIELDDSISSPDQLTATKFKILDSVKYYIGSDIQSSGTALFMAVNPTTRKLYVRQVSPFNSSSSQRTLTSDASIVKIIERSFNTI